MTPQRLTIMEWIEETLSERLISQEDVATVVPLYQRTQPDLQGRWTDDIDGYPLGMKNHLFVSLCDFVVNWLDDNGKSKHAGRRLFVLPKQFVGHGDLSKHQR